MFGRVAGRYDLLNHLLSFQTDRYWRARTVSRVHAYLQRPDARILDLCCGTGDLLLALARARGAGRYSAATSAIRCCVEARKKVRGTGGACKLFEADALQLPLAGASLDLITIAFGFRNLVNYRRGLEELRRVLKPGGALAILEFSQPSNPLFASLYGFYSSQVLPRWVA